MRFGQKVHKFCELYDLSLNYEHDAYGIWCTVEDIARYRRCSKDEVIDKALESAVAAWTIIKLYEDANSYQGA